MIDTDNNRMFYRKSVLVLFNIITNAVIMIYCNYINSLTSDNWMLKFTIASVVQLAINIYTIFALENSLFTLTILFIVFSYITHLGMLVIHGFSINVFLPWDPLLSISKDEFKAACYFTIFSQAFLSFGMNFVLFKRKPNDLSNGFILYDDEEVELYKARLIGKILITIGILPMLYIDIQRIILYRSLGYLATYNLGTNGFVTTIGRATEIGAILLILGNKKNKNKALIIMGISMLYECLIIFTGNRGRPVMFILTMLYIYFNYVKTIKFKELIKLSIFAYLSGFILTFVGHLRSIPLNSINSIIDLAKTSFIKFSPFRILAEFGMTIITLARSIVIINDNTGSIKLGITYLQAVFTIFPNVGGSLSSIIDSTVFVSNWPQNLKQSIGGSYLGEIYWNYGKYGYIFTIAIGIFIALISNKMYELNAKKRYVYLSICLVLFPNLLWWIRDYFMSMVREFVWISILILLLYDILNRKEKTK